MLGRHSSLRRGSDCIRIELCRVTPGPGPGFRKTLRGRRINAGSVNRERTLEKSRDLRGALRALGRVLGQEPVNELLDGQRRNLDSPSTQLTIADVFRGIHTVEAVVIDSSGRELARSAPTTFIVQQTSVTNPK